MEALPFPVGARRRPPRCRTLPDSGILPRAGTIRRHVGTRIPVQECAPTGNCEAQGAPRGQEAGSKESHWKANFPNGGQVVSHHLAYGCSSCLVQPPAFTGEAAGAGPHAGQRADSAMRCTGTAKAWHGLPHRRCVHALKMHTVVHYVMTWRRLRPRQGDKATLMVLLSVMLRRLRYSTVCASTASSSRHYCSMRSVQSTLLVTSRSEAVA